MELFKNENKVGNVYSWFLILFNCAMVRFRLVSNGGIGGGFGIFTFVQVSG